MDFELSEEQRMFKDAAAEFAKEKLFPKAQEFEEKEEFPPELLKELANLGYFGMLLPEQYGGSGSGFVSYACTLEEFSKGCAALGVLLSVHNSLVCGAILQYGNEEQKKKYLPKLAKGEILGAYSLTEPQAGTDAGNLKTTAVLKDSNYVINGTKSFVSNGKIA
ncbi:MAG: acyl-CoA dehydrogenase family protein, partial [candidate division Zixibacteria bacterium]|nr:acyl-CoA dehydrogenase family protein [candidate division Zixibacteria bacterium]